MAKNKKEETITKPAIKNLILLADI
jgi:hypothetical protein